MLKYALLALRGKLEANPKQPSVRETDEHLNILEERIKEINRYQWRQWKLIQQGRRISEEYVLLEDKINTLKKPLYHEYGLVPRIDDQGYWHLDSGV